MSITRARSSAREEAWAVSPSAVEELVTADLLAAYADSALFDEAIAVALADHAQRHEPLTEELAALTAALAKKERVRQRYQDDYEDGRLAAERYEARAGELDDELAGLRARAAELQSRLAQPDVPRSPSPAKLQELRDELAHRFRTGDISLRKTPYTALIAKLEVHDIDDIPRPTVSAAPHLRLPLSPGTTATEWWARHDPREGHPAALTSLIRPDLPS